MLKTKKNVIFSNFSFDFYEGKSVCMIGPNGVGKTSLLKMVQESIPYEGDILKEGICRVLVDVNIKEHVNIYEFLQFRSLNTQESQLFLRFLKLTDLSYAVSNLNTKYQLKVQLLKEILARPKFLFVDDILFSFSMDEKKDLLKLLSSFGITLFYVTSDIEDTLLFPYLLVIGKDGILMEGSTLQVLQEEKIMKRLGFTLPFFVDLSLQLKSYGLVDQIYLSEKELVKALWQ